MDAREAYSVKVLSDPFVNGDECYFVQNWIEGNEYGSSIFRMAHGRVERVTFGGSERSPPSVYGGYLYYISSAGGEESLMRMGRMSGPERVATFGKIHKFLPYNDDMLAIVEAKAEAGTLFVAKRQMYRYDTRGGYLRSRKKLVSVKGGRDIVAGDFDVVDFAVSGDDVIVSTTEEDDSTGLHQVYRLISGLSGREKLTGGRGGLATSVGFTPSGEAVFIGHRSGIAPWKQKSVMAADGRVLSGGVNCSLDVITDLFVGGAQGLVTDGSLYTIAHEGGDTYVYDVLARKRLTGRGGMSVRYFHSSGGNLAYILTEPGRPSLLRFGEQEYDPNPGVRGGAEVENFRTGGGGEYWFIHSGSERPTVLSVHGGPHMAYGNCYYIEFNFLAANGFNVVYGNPRGGSSGYGDDFARACVGDWGGGRDFEDVLSFLDDARDRFGLTGKVAITGGSYGGAS
ncbi:prolyl oligopeptidase family serine peptidase [Thermogymnomonas acidicola]|uniref:alpha/beta hydrolase family protein n=1 Tax=Thermogymnomonas acidicola TaxID=399579 RepID=UPI000A921F98|nr:prolyl oligopeptidase family serine peptidase [Thermogymnomonas acidicola]